MAKSSSIYTRVEPAVKEQAEQVLSQLGIPMSNAINLFLRQIVLQKGIPFEMKLPQRVPLDSSALTEAQFNAEIEKGLADLSAGRVVPSKQVAENMRRLYDV
ncbi:XRE family transcriptional regulator [Clostridia bacterium]|nr:XRE family transcriptional regulator [Clostridia bacterium]